MRLMRRTVIKGFLCLFSSFLIDHRRIEIEEDDLGGYEIPDHVTQILIREINAQNRLIRASRRMYRFDSGWLIDEA